MRVTPIWIFGVWHAGNHYPDWALKNHKTTVPLTTCEGGAGFAATQFDTPIPLAGQRED
jgi:hypothetical protein